MADTAPLTVRDLNRATLARQGLLEPMGAPSVGAAVERLGSLQAQHPVWRPVALASRAADAAPADLATGLQRREVVRSSLMRITIHVVSADDLWPMFTVCQPLHLSQWRSAGAADIELQPFEPLPAHIRKPIISEAERVLALIAADATPSVRIGD